MLIFLAFVFFTVAYFAEPVVNEFPKLGKGVGAVRGFFDDFAAGDPNKIVNYKSATAIVIGKNYESANIKYPISGYFMTTGIIARNDRERQLLEGMPVGGGMVIFYDPVNPTIAVMEPTWNEAQRKMRGVHRPTGGTQRKQRDGKISYMPGFGYNPMVNYVRISCCVVGVVLLFLGATPPKDD